MTKGRALYIHIPFCRQKCLYCDFPSQSGKEKLMLDYIKALGKEIDKIGEISIDTIFIGGGTPTYLSLECLEILKEHILPLNKSEQIEFTIEGNPGSFNREKLELFKAMGANRLSIGLQAWQNRHLKKLGRIHDIEAFIHGFKLAREVGFENINVDIMFGIPNQTIEDWVETLENVIAIGPEHISCYSLIIEEGTPFYSMYEEDRLQLPDEDSEREMYHTALKLLKSAGYIQYEISNFAKLSKECRHNLVYWNLDEYLACGAGAHGYVNKTRYRNTDNLEQYILFMNTAETAVSEETVSSFEDEMEEFMFMGLRKTEGISLSEFRERFGIEIFKVYGEVIEKYTKRGLLSVSGYRLFLTPEGIELSNTVMSDFILN